MSLFIYFVLNKGFIHSFIHLWNWKNWDTFCHPNTVCPKGYEDRERSGWRSGMVIICPSHLYDPGSTFGPARMMRFVNVSLTPRVFLRLLRFSSLRKIDSHSSQLWLAVVSIEQPPRGMLIKSLFFYYAGINVATNCTCTCKVRFSF